MDFGKEQTIDVSFSSNPLSLIIDPQFSVDSWRGERSRMTVTTNTCKTECFMGYNFSASRSLRIQSQLYLLTIYKGNRSRQEYLASQSEGQRFSTKSVWIQINLIATFGWLFSPVLLLCHQLGHALSSMKEAAICTLAVSTRTCTLFGNRCPRQLKCSKPPAQRRLKLNCCPHTHPKSTTSINKHIRSMCPTFLRISQAIYSREEVTLGSIYQS